MPSDRATHAENTGAGVNALAKLVALWAGQFRRFCRQEAWHLVF
jgi:hypothetical protein